MLSAICQSLNLYSGRERTLRVLQYGTLLCSGSRFLSQQHKDALRIFSSKLSETRTVLRLFDDLPMLQYTLQYGLGTTKEPDAWLRVLGLLNNIFDQLYYPLEHIAWLIDNKIVQGRKDHPYNDGAVTCWTISLYLHIAKAIRYLVILRSQRAIALGSPTEKIDYQLTEIRNRQWFHLLSIFQASADLCNAVNWMPAGFLWSGKFLPWQIGLFGTLSSFISIYKSRHYPAVA